jgi:hypothetical protein
MKSNAKVQNCQIKNGDGFYNSVSEVYFTFGTVTMTAKNCNRIYSSQSDYMFTGPKRKREKIKIRLQMLNLTLDAADRAADRET